MVVAIFLYSVLSVTTTKRKNWLVLLTQTYPFHQLIGYKAQFDQLIDNTLAFLNGYNANNVLLVGSRGTGKSSSVKALVNEYHEQGLRLLEITKEQIEKLPDILKLLKTKRKKVYYIH